jgi:hypothetical protein
MSSVLDLFDVMAPRVYVIPDSAYQEYTEKQNKKRVAELDSSISYYEDQIGLLRAKREKLLAEPKK